MAQNIAQTEQYKWPAPFSHIYHSIFVSVILITFTLHIIDYF